MCLIAFGATGRTAMVKDGMKTAAELVRRGATILAEPCKSCGGIQVKYKGKTYCTAHEDLSSVLAGEELTYDSVASELATLLLSKLKDGMVALRSETDVAKQDQLVSLMAKCVNLLHELQTKDDRTA